MAEGTVDSLQVEVTVLSDKAIASLNRLKDTLNGIKRTLGGREFHAVDKRLEADSRSGKTRGKCH